MCNKLHRDHWKIEEEGKAFKLFKITKDNQLLSCVDNCTYDISDDDWINFDKDEIFQFTIMGFCAFKTKNEAQIACKGWNKSMMTIREYKVKVVPIEYRDGKGSHIEDKFVGDEKYQIIIIGSFKLEEGSKYHF